MNAARRGCYALALALMVGVTAARADDADTLYNEGKTAFKAHDYPTAYEKYKAAFAMKQSADIAGNLAQVEVELGKKTDAAGHLSYALRILPANAKPGLEKALRDTLGGLKKELCTVHVTTSVTGATVTVDGRPIGQAPLQDPVFIDAGEHVIDATLNAHTSKKQSIDARRGADLDVSVELTPVAAIQPTASASTTPSTAPTGTPAKPPSTPRSFVPDLLLIGVGAVSIGVGAGAFAGAASADVDAETIAKENINGKGRCNPAAPATLGGACDDFASAVSSQHTWTTVGGVMMGIGGAALGTGILLLVLPRGGSEQKDPKSPSVTLMPVVGTTTKALAAFGVW